MKWIWASIGAVIALIVIINFFGLRATESDLELKLPEGFAVETFAQLEDSPVSYPGPNAGPRMLLIKDGVLYATITNQGKIVALPDQDKSGKLDQEVTLMEGLNRPHGIDYSDGWFYIAEEDRVFRVREGYGISFDEDSMEVLMDLPEGGHFTRTLKIHNNYIFLTVGSSCNVCSEDDSRRASMLRCNLDGSDCITFASGLRNTVGFAFDSKGNIYGTDNGRDLLGDNLPPDEINLIRNGKDYGWPTCYGKNIHDTDFDNNVYAKDPCSDKEASAVDLQAHSAPLGLAFYYGSDFPEEYRGKLFVAYHGSWNRNEPTGYKIVYVDVYTGEAKDFATGWLKDGKVSGRPVDILFSDGSMYVSDDNSGRIYRIWYEYERAL